MEICLEGGQGSSRTIAPYGTGTTIIFIALCISFAIMFNVFFGTKHHFYPGIFKNL
jgi:hypothetical protein